MSSTAPNFRAKILTSTKLSGIRFASDVGLRLVSTVILTRLLEPEIYGVFAIVLVYIYMLEMFSDLGLRSLILTREGDVSDTFLRTCWSISILRGLFILLVSAAISVVINMLQGQGVFAPDSPYSAEVLPWAITAIGCTSFVLGLNSPNAYMRERNMDFGRVTLVYVIIHLSGLIITIALAYYLRSVWALVIGFAAKTVIQVTLSFLAFPGPSMRFDLNRHDFGIVIDRGKWIIGHSALHALSKSADRLVLGFAMSASTFGLYSIARQLVDLIPMFLTSLDQQMGLQVFTHLHKSTVDQFRRNYYRYRLFFDALAGLSAGAGMVMAPLLIQLVFDDRYQGIAPIVQVLIWSVLVTGPTLLRTAFIAERRFKQMTLLSVVTAVTLWVGLCVAVFVFDSVPAALMIIALHRLPEAIIITLLAGDRDWIIIWREFISFGFCVVGALVGWGLVLAWNTLT
jgi:O-antigen/teichoic acid export membrane protein